MTTKELQDAVKYVRKHYPMGNKTDWSKVKELLKSDLSTEAIRSRYRRTLSPERELSFEQILLNKIKQKRTIDWLTTNLSTTKENIMATLAELQANGFRNITLWQEEGTLWVHNRQIRKTTVPKELPLKTLRFAVVSDTHIGSVQHDNAALHKFYDLVEERGIDTVLHAGDLTDGYYPNRTTSILEQTHVGFSNQIKETVRSYPSRPNITTYFISGNHDYSHARNGFADVGETVEAVREDMIYLGHNYGRFWLNEGVSVSLIHPTDGIARNFNKKIRDIVERHPEKRGDVMLIGHYHKVAMVRHQGCYAYVVPAMQRQTSFMRDNGLESVVGGMIIEVRLDELGRVAGVVSEIVEL